MRDSARAKEKRAIRERERERARESEPVRVLDPPLWSSS